MIHLLPIFGKILLNFDFLGRFCSKDEFFQNKLQSSKGLLFIILKRNQVKPIDHTALFVIGKSNEIPILVLDIGGVL